MAAVGMPGVVRNVNLQITASQSGQLQVVINGVRQQLQALQRSAQAVGTSITTTGAQTTAAINKLHTPFDRLNRQIKNVFAVAVAFEFIRAISFVENAIAQLAKQGILFNSTLEQGAIALAAILTATRQYTDSQGRALDASQAFVANLARAGILQKDLLQASIDTLGTDQELVDAYRLVLALTANQKATDRERLLLAQTLVNTSKVFGQQQQETFIEVRQILQAQRDIGQVLLLNAGSSSKIVREHRAQGAQVQYLLELFKDYQAIAGRLGQSFIGLVSTTETLINNLTAANFTQIFEGVKEFLKGINDELSNIITIPVHLTASAKELFNFGRAVGQIISGLTEKLAEYLVTLAVFVIRNKEGLKAVHAVFLTFLQLIELIVTTLGKLATAYLDIIATTSRPQKEFFDFSGIENLVKRTKSVLNNLVDSTKSSFISLTDAISKSLNDILRAFPSTIKAVFQSFLVDIETLRSGLTRLGKDLTQELFSPFNQRLSETNEIVKNFSQNTTRNVVKVHNAFNEMFSAILAFGKSILNEIFSPLDTRLKETEMIGRRVGKDLAQNVSSVAQTGALLSQMFTSLFEKMVLFFKGFVENIQLINRFLRDLTLGVTATLFATGFNPWFAAIVGAAALIGLVIDLQNEMEKLQGVVDSPVFDDFAKRVRGIQEEVLGPIADAIKAVNEGGQGAETVLNRLLDLKLELEMSFRRSLDE